MVLIGAPSSFSCLKNYYVWAAQHIKVKGRMILLADNHDVVVDKATNRLASSEVDWFTIKV